MTSANVGHIIFSFTVYSFYGRVPLAATLAHYGICLNTTRDSVAPAALTVSLVQISTAGHAILNTS